MHQLLLDTRVTLLELQKYDDKMSIQIITTKCYKQSKICCISYVPIYLPHGILRKCTCNAWYDENYDFVVTFFVISFL